jgi:hypothetical protein
MVTDVGVAESFLVESTAGKLVEPANLKMSTLPTGLELFTKSVKAN